jgi:hypothetical protein
MVAYGGWHMLKAPPFRLEGALNRRRNCGRLQRKSKKILNRGNEPKDLLETQHLAVFWSEKRTQNELDFECKKRLSKRKSRFRVQGSRCQVQEEQVSGFRFQVSGARSAVAREYYAARLPAGYSPPEPAPENVSRGTKSPQQGRLHSESSGSLGRGCYFSTLDFRLLDFEKLNEQCGNIYENKGPLWKTRW